MLGEDGYAMRARNTLCCFILCACTGCLYTTDVESGWGMFANSFRNLAEIPLYSAYSVATANRNRKLAEKAWEEICPSFQTPASKDYITGFKDGYADYLDAGGTGEPPPYPPYCYRTGCYQNEEGQKAMQDWFAGFRHGAATARASGLREIFLVEVPGVPAKAERPYRPAGVPLANQKITESPQAELPPPRVAP